MEFIHSNIRPISIKSEGFFKKFVDNANLSDYILITSGYISADSITFFQRNINTLPKFDVVIGMHAFDGFSQAQFAGIKNLTEYMSVGQKAWVCKAFPFHGKIYSFFKKDIPFSSIIGSSNFSRITDVKSRIFETDLLVDDADTIKRIVDLQLEIRDSASVEFNDYDNPKIIDDEKNNPIANLDEIEVIGWEEHQRFIQSATAVSFNLPLKCERKSNLNVYFGRGRDNMRGYVIPRPWYEVEIIVGKAITSLPDYPKNIDFTVITDDRFKFDCTTNGQNSKNFRSKGELTILGAWLKGRLERKGVLSVGDFINPETLEAYGRNTITLTKTSIDNTWLLDFSV